MNSGGKLLESFCESALLEKLFNFFFPNLRTIYVSFFFLNSSVEKPLVLLQTLCACPELQRYFSFARGYTECLHEMISVLRNVLLTVNTVIKLAADPISSHTKDRVSLRFNEHHSRKDIFSFVKVFWCIVMESMYVLNVL